MESDAPDLTSVGKMGAETHHVNESGVEVEETLVAEDAEKLQETIVTLEATVIPPGPSGKEPMTVPEPIQAPPSEQALKLAPPSIGSKYIPEEFLEESRILEAAAAERAFEEAEAADEMENANESEIAGERSGGLVGIFSNLPFQ